MNTITVFCSHHNQYGQCTIEDYQDAKSGCNPSGMLRVKFDTFTQAVPFNTIKTWEQMKEQNEMDAFDSIDNIRRCSLCGEDRTTACECGETDEMDAYWHQYDEMKRQYEEMKKNIDNP